VLFKARHVKADAAVEARRQLLRSCDGQLQQLENELAEIAERKTNATVEQKRLEHPGEGPSLAPSALGAGFQRKGEYLCLCVGVCASHGGKEGSTSMQPVCA